MKKKIATIITFGLIAAASISRADVYTGTTGNIFPDALANDPFFDISSVGVTNDSTNVYFKINLMYYPAGWANYSIAFVTGPGGCTVGNGSAATNTTSLGIGMNDWVTCPGTSNGLAQMFQYDTNSQTWGSTSGATYAVNGQSVSITVPYASLGLAPGSGFQFDVYSADANNGAIDDLANPGQAASWYTTAYSNNLVNAYPNPAPPSFIYYDNTNDTFTTGAPQLDISSVQVMSVNSSNISFTINLAGAINSGNNWGHYAIALVTGSGGDTNSNGSGALIGLSEGINYWVTCLGWGSPQLWQFNTNTLVWTQISGAATYSSLAGGNAIALTVPYASLGLKPASGFKFNAYTFGGPGEGANDDLANPTMASSWWNSSYTNSLVETYPLAVYNDAIGDLFTTNAPFFDISAAGVWNDSTNVNFTIDLAGLPDAPNDWGSYSIAFVTGPGGDTNSNGSGYAISLTEGMTFWATCLGHGLPQLFEFNTNTLTWSSISGATYGRNGDSITLAVPYANLGLQAGSTFQFDIYTSGSSIGDGAVDDLANPLMASSYWNVPYTNNLVETYTLTGAVSLPPSPTLYAAAAGNQLNLTVSSVIGHSYILESTPNLSLPVWTPVSTNSGTGSVITNIQTISTGSVPAFYRYLVQ